MSRSSMNVGCWLVLSILLGVSPAVSQDSSTREKVKQQATDEKDGKKVATSTIPIFVFNTAVLEAPAADDPFLLQQGAESLKDIVARMKKAQQDERVPAVIIELGTGAMIGGAQLEELHQALSDIRAAGKPVYAFADSLSFRHLALLAAASRISVAPVGDLFINGMYGEQIYLRGLLNKIDVTPDFLTCGAYKSAAETFMRKKPSPEADEMMQWLFDSMYNTYVEMIATGRDMPKQAVLDLVNHGLYSAEKAVELGVIDACEFRADMIKQIHAAHGTDVKLSKKYGKKNKGGVDFSNPFWALKLWSEALSGESDSRSKKDSVAVIYVEGAIVPGSPQPSPFGSSGTAYSDPIRIALDKAAEDDHVKAVVLRVNSPGGSAVASEIILAATKRVAARKPFVVSMGDVAGSGGYYVACGTDTIFADAATITASIGVVAGKLATHEMWDNLGIHWQPIARGKNAGMMSAAETFTSAQRDILQNWMNEVYGDFKGHVINARGDRLKKPIDELAGGRVFTGQQALESGLVDKLGTLDDAIQFAAAKAELTDYEIRVLPRPKNMVEMLFSDLAGKDPDDGRLGMGMSQLRRTDSIWKAALPLLDGLQPQRAAVLQQTLVQLEMLQHESLSLITPSYIWID